MKIFITGLCFQGNKGGPAIALSLLEHLRKAFSNSEYTFSVPGESYGESFEAEQEWAAKYGVNVVENFSHYDLFKYLITKPVTTNRVVTRWIATLKSADLVLDMTAISYVGPPLGKTKRIVLHGRFRYFVLAKLFRRPFLAWTQSYGPFSNAIIRTLAKRDLANLPIIFCRGEECEESVKQLLPNAITRSFPDVAVTLNYDRSASEELIPGYFSGPKRVVTLSPSAVIYARQAGLSGDNAHVAHLVKLVNELNAKGFKILLVPHTFNVVTHNPKVCDYGVCLELLRKIDVNQIDISLLEGDLSAKTLKSIISQAYIHIGGRYHSLVASLSTGVPSIALSWHHKYRDLMEQYGVGGFVIEDTYPGQTERTQLALGEIVSNHANIRHTLRECHQSLAMLVNENVDLLVYSYQKLI